MIPQVTRFTRRRDWPAHLPSIADQSIGILARFWWTQLARLKLALSGCAVGPGLVVDGRLLVSAYRRGSIRLGPRVTLVSRCAANRVGLTGPTILDCGIEGRIEIGDSSGMSATVLSSRNLIRIGAFVKIGGNARIYDHDFHALDWRQRRMASTDHAHARSKPVIIEDDVFIGANALILKGVTIGARAVIGAGSVVTADVPPDEVWAGNPASRVRRLTAP